MKSILISTQPKWCEKICRKIGEENGIPVYLKPVEVRKSAPKEVPFRAYIYQTKKPVEVWLNGTGRHISEYDKTCWYNDGSGKVIGEFVCDRVDKFSCKCIPRQSIAFGYERFIKDGVYLLNNNDTDYVVFERQDRYLDTMLKNADLAAMCLSPQELFKYAGGFSKPLYAWHISDLKIYDKPRGLCEFTAPCKHNKSKPDESCKGCPYIFKGMTSGKLTCDRALTRAPQSWQYVEEI